MNEGKVKSCPYAVSDTSIVPDCDEIFFFCSIDQGFGIVFTTGDTDNADILAFQQRVQFLLICAGAVSLVMSRR